MTVEPSGISESPLERLRGEAAGLKALGLRSTSVVVWRLLPLIERALVMGFSHSIIRQALIKGGLELTGASYQTFVYRGRRKARLGGAQNVREVGNKSEPAPLQPEPTTYPSLLEAPVVLDALWAAGHATDIGRRDYSDVVQNQSRRTRK